MSVEDRWHFANKKAATKAGVDDPCTCKGNKFPTKEHARGQQYRVRVRGASVRSFDKLTDAKAYNVTVRSELQQGRKPINHRAGNILFNEYAPRVVKQRHYTGESSETVLGRLNNDLIPAFGTKRMCDITPSLTDAWLAKMRATPRKTTGRPPAPATVARTYDLFSLIMKSAVRDKLIGESPCHGVEYPKEPPKQQLDIWEHETVEAILDGIPDRDHATALVSATCGHRQGESFAVAVEDIQWLRKQIVIRHQVQRIDGRLRLLPVKGGKPRTVPLPDLTAKALSKHIEDYPDTITVRCEDCPGRCAPSTLLFHTDGQMLRSEKWNRDVWRPALRRATITPNGSRTGQHQYRHYYASRLIYGGASIHEVKAWLGHSSIQITDNYYGHLFKQAAERARNIMDAAFSARVSPLRPPKIV